MDSPDFISRFSSFSSSNEIYANGENSSAMAWMGQVPVLFVRLRGIINLLGAVGLILPSWLRIKPLLTPWAAVCIIILMIGAIIFYVLRKEASVIVINIVAAILAVFIAWGRFTKSPTSSK